MHLFTLERPPDLIAALALGADGPATEYIAGGTDMIPLLKDELRRPDRLVALRPGVLDDAIEIGARGELHLGAGALMSEVADHPDVRRAFPLIAAALLASASPQIRNMATLGGNLLQRTRCPYYRDAGVSTCNKRRPSSGCAALEGDNRHHAVLGGSDHCIATHPSDLAVALVALDATVHLRGLRGERRVALEAFYRVPGDTPEIETVIEAGELITAIEVPGGEALARHAHYLKMRDRASFEFALVSAAVALDVDGDRIRDARVAMGGVATVPWRLRSVEQALVGIPTDPVGYPAAVARATAGAVPRSHNAFKVDLMPRVLLRALEIAGRRR